MKSYKLKDYVAAGCPEMEYPSMVSLVGFTGGKVCDIGCHAFNNGSCKAYRKLITPLAQQAEPVETVREKAKRLGVSIKEVRKQRRELYNG